MTLIWRPASICHMASLAALGTHYSLFYLLMNYVLKNKYYYLLLLLLQSDLITAVHTGKISLMAMLDLTAAFDCVDHLILSSTSSQQLRIGSTNNRLGLFLSDRTVTACQVWLRFFVSSCNPVWRPTGFSPLTFAVSNVHSKATRSRTGQGFVRPCVFWQHTAVRELLVIASCCVTHKRHTLHRRYHEMDDLE